MIFSSRHFFQKNERTNSTLLLWYLRSTCFRLFFGRIWRQQKDIFEINWPLDLHNNPNKLFKSKTPVLTSSFRGSTNLIVLDSCTISFVSNFQGLFPKCPQGLRFKLFEICNLSPTTHKDSFFLKTKEFYIHFFTDNLIKFLTISLLKSSSMIIW